MVGAPEAVAGPPWVSYILSYVHEAILSAWRIWIPCMRGDVYQLKGPRDTRGHEQRGSRHAVVVRSDLLPLSMWLVAPTRLFERRPQVLPARAGLQHRFQQRDRRAAVRPASQPSGWQCGCRRAA